ncbi:unnamed protein product [Closterium sp. Naga37s-1]|nr:unnamed protein product [Closterium sp. Naga37s-1]
MRWERRGAQGEEQAERRAGELRVGEQRVGEQRVGEQRVGEQRVGEQRVGEQRVGEQRVGEQRVGEQRVGEQRVGEQRVGEQRVGEQRVGEQRVGEQRVGEQRVGDPYEWEGGRGEGRRGGARGGDVGEGGWDGEDLATVSLSPLLSPVPGSPSSLANVVSGAIVPPLLPSFILLPISTFPPLRFALPFNVSFPPPPVLPSSRPPLLFSSPPLLLLSSSPPVLPSSSPVLFSSPPLLLPSSSPPLLSSPPPRTPPVPYGGRHVLEVLGLSDDVATADVEAVIHNLVMEATCMDAAGRAESDLSCSSSNSATNTASIPFVVRWINESHALAVFLTPALASSVLSAATAALAGAASPPFHFRPLDTASEHYPFIRRRGE